MQRMGNKTFHRTKITVTFFGCVFLLGALFIRLLFLMVIDAEYYAKKADELHERERSIKAQRGQILDRNGIVIADNKTVCTVSVIHSQIEDKAAVIDMLCKELSLSEEYVRKRVEKNSSIERVKSNVDKDIGDRIRLYDLSGVKVDEDYKRYYPYDSLASKVLGFTGADNQGIIGLEVVYDSYLQGKNGTILTMTDAKGIEIENAGERRIEPIAGGNLHISMDLNIQSYATQLANQAMETKDAEGVSIIVMNVKNGELLAMVNVPEFDLNNPFTLSEEFLMSVSSGDAQGSTEYSAKEKQNLLNKMWRNASINDTYEPGSTFKIITAAAGLEEKVVTPESGFSCPGYIIVGDRKIRCHKVGGHGSETFVQGTMNSCKQVFT